MQSNTYNQKKTGGKKKWQHVDSVFPLNSERSHQKKNIATEKEKQRRHREREREHEKQG